MEVHGQLLEPRADAAELLEPADALLGDAPAAVGPAVEPHRRVVAGRFVVLVRDHRLDLLSPQPVAHPLHAVRLVAGELPGLVPALAFLASPPDQGRDRLPDDRLGPRRLVDLPGRDFDGKGSARTVSDHTWNFDPNPPRLRPNAWSAGSSGGACRSTLFCQPRPRRGRRGRSSRPRTTAPSRCTPACRA